MSDTMEWDQTDGAAMLPSKPPSSQLCLGRRSLLRSLGGAAFLELAPWRSRAEVKAPWRIQTDKGRSPFRVGAFKRIYDPSQEESAKWYINDHTFIRANNGRWHLFGITHPEPADAQKERFFAHATAPHVTGPWTKEPAVMYVDEALGETVVWAPYVVQHDGLYWMYYCGGGVDHEKYKIHLATSSDLFTWKRHPANPMVVDGYDARDPMVMRHKDRWVLYYAATSMPGGGHHTVKAVTSQDLTHWSGKTEVFVDPEVGTFGGPTESPFVVVRDGNCYLFVCTNRGYNETAVYASRDAFHWDSASLIGTFPAHAAEVIHTPEERWFVSRAGWGQGGVYLAELTWTD
jgi:sucrose-6-phosphate hydrolase SacC (GH32 family)